MSGGVATNQCWGTPRYIECKCSDGSTHSFAGCDCENGSCPQGGGTATSEPAPAVTPTSEPEPEPEPTASTPEPEPEPEPAVGTGGCKDQTMTGGWRHYSCAQIQNIGAAYCAYPEVKTACCFCGGAGLSQTEAAAHLSKATTQRQKFLRSKGSSMMSQDVEREDMDEFLFETSNEQTEEL